MLRKLPDKISRFLIYLTAFGVSALMAIMLIHIIKESIPAFSELGIKMFLPSTEWRPVSANPQFGLLPAITGTLYVSFIAVVLALIFGVACACFLNFYLPEKIAAVFLAFIDLVAGIPSVIFWIYRTYCPGKKFCHTISYGSRTMYSRCRDCTGNHAAAIRYLDLSRIYSRCTYTI